MPRRPHVIPGDRITLWIPRDLKSKLDLLLWSDVESRVPHGAYTKFFSTILKSRLDEIEKERRQ